MKPSSFLVILAVIVAGCVQTDFDVEPTPAGDSLDRELKVYRRLSADSDMPDEDLKRLAREYKIDPPAIPKGKTFSFRGRFAGRMPNDIGGHGTFHRCETPFGSASLYVERFRGNDDVAGELKERQAAADRLVEVLAGWLETELKNEPQWAALRRFVDQDLRRDLYNLGIYAWTLALTPPGDDLREPVVRGMQYLVERGYLSYEDIPAILRVLNSNSADADQQLLMWLKRIIKSRLRDVAPPRLDILETPERLIRSLGAYLETTDEYAVLRREWQTKLADDPKAEKPDATIVLSKPFGRLFLGALEFGGDQVSVALKTDRPAVFTNGTWSPDTGQVKWTKQSVPIAESRPVLVYAVWGEPDEAAQRKCFGRVVLREKSLAEYCVWYRGLYDAERREWDAFVQTLRPGPDLKEELRAFRFSHEPVGGDRNKRLARSVVEAIVRELNRDS